MADIEAIQGVHPTVVHVNGGTDTFDSNGNRVELDDAAIAIETTRLAALYVTLEYSRNRKAEYDVLNQFELISDDAINSTTTHADAISAIKTKWPKNNTGPVE